jgi:pSer/pThr/pTyr-binding forkhead associated (FHA) protein
MFAVLRVTNGLDHGKTFTVVNGEVLTIGNDPQAVDRIRDPRIARAQCRVHCEQDHAVLSDCKDSTGTRVNGKPITTHTLQSGDVIQIGSTQLVYQWTDADEGSTCSFSVLPILPPAARVEKGPGEPEP